MEHEYTVFPEQHNTTKQRTIKYITTHCTIQLSIVHNIKALTHNITQKPGTLLHSYYTTYMYIG